eukprot:3127863-Rhodomonas_salina.1
MADSCDTVDCASTLLRQYNTRCTNAPSVQKLPYKTPIVSVSLRRTLGGREYQDHGEEHRRVAVHVEVSEPWYPRSHVISTGVRA